MLQRKRHPLLSPRPAHSPSLTPAVPWDSSQTDVTRFRASPREIVQRKLATTSKFNALGALELRRKLGDLQGAPASLPPLPPPPPPF